MIFTVKYSSGRPFDSDKVFHIYNGNKTVQAVRIDTLNQLLEFVSETEYPVSIRDDADFGNSHYRCKALMILDE